MILLVIFFLNQYKRIDSLSLVVQEELRIKLLDNCPMFAKLLGLESYSAYCMVVSLALIGYLAAGSRNARRTLCTP
ncbi:MAG: hypothetical protein BWK76_12345 [Desulfobulbaceae bacterium A2]|nr:MAG: hypothetical protein BWK76_12345 [Desulfobulbaceae bacterium A2]